MRDVDADPLPPELLRRVDRRAAAAERIEHDVAWVGRGGDDALKERERAFALGSRGVLGPGS